MISLTKILGDPPLGVLPGYQSLPRGNYDPDVRRMGGTTSFTYLHTTFYFQMCFTLIEDKGSDRFLAVLETWLTELQSLVFYLNFKGLALVLLNLWNNEIMQRLWL